MAFFKSFGFLVRFIGKYLYYFVSARHFRGYGLHSPFIFGLYKWVISKKDDEMLESIKKFRKYLMKSNELIHCESDAGAGSRYSGQKNQTKLSSLVKHSSVPHKYGKILYYLVNTLKPVNILELGTSVGISTLYMALAGEKSKVWSIEGCADKIRIAEDNMQTLGINNLYLYNGWFDEQLPKVLHHMPSVDMVFIDGDHRMENILDYFELILDYVHNDTILVLDDIHWSPGMESAWDEIRYYEEVRVSVDLFRMGIVFFKKELSPETFIIRY